MTKKDRNILIAIGAAALLLFGGAAVSGSFTSVLQTFIPSVEGFSATPIWDYKQWSWGYGTAAGYDQNNKPAGTITTEKAWQEALKVINSHYDELSKYVQKNLDANQWAALLSFSYNTGTGNAKNIVDTINTGTTADVVTRMKKYVYAGGVYNQGLMNRRVKETDLYQGKTGTGSYAVETIFERIHPDLIGEVEY